jgi:hypothetical protein
MEQQSSSNDLGTRVLNAARLAVAMHLAHNAQLRNDGATVTHAAAGRKVLIGGTGPHFVTDDTPTIAATADRAARDNSSRAA